MGKKTIVKIPKPLVGLFPVPIVLVTTIDSRGKPNVFTVGWVGVACSEPPMISVAVRPQRFSHKLIDESGEFVINVPNVDLLKAVEYCGNKSGRSVDKFDSAHLEIMSSNFVRSPLIEQCPVNLECEVRHKVKLGTHDLFIGEVVATHIDTSCLSDQTLMRVDFKKVNPIIANLYEYWSVGTKIGEIFKVSNTKLRIGVSNEEF